MKALNGTVLLSSKLSLYKLINSFVYLLICWLIYLYKSIYPALPPPYIYLIICGVLTYKRYGPNLDWLKLRLFIIRYLTLFYPYPSLIIPVKRKVIKITIAIMFLAVKNIIKALMLEVDSILKIITTVLTAKKTMAIVILMTFLLTGMIKLG